MLIPQWSKGVDWASFFHEVKQPQRVLHESGRASLGTIPGNLTVWAPHPACSQPGA